MILDKTLKSSLNCKGIQSVNPKGNQSWIFIGRTNTEAETPIVWPLKVKNWLTGKDLNSGKDWRWKGTTEDEMVGLCHQLNGHEFKEVLGAGDGQGGLECYSPWGCKESDTTEWLNWTELKRWGLSEVIIAFQKVMRVEVSWMGLVPLSKNPQRTTLSLLQSRDTREKTADYEPGS